MKLLAWNKMKRLYQNFETNRDDCLFIISVSPESHLSQESNFEVLKNRYSHSEEVLMGERKILLIKADSPQVADLQRELDNLEGVSVLDESHYKQKVNFYRNRASIKKCSLCHRDLTKEESISQTMGDICEEKSRHLEEASSLEEFEFEFKGLQSEKLQQGKSFVLYTDKGLSFVEVINQSNGTVELLDRRKMRKLLNEHQETSQAFADSYMVMKNEEILQMATPNCQINKQDKELKTLLDGLFDE